MGSGVTTPWEAVPGATGIFRAQYKVPRSTSCSTLVSLGDNRYLVYSPGRGLENCLTDFLSDDAKLLLLAPSTGHNLGIAPWSDAHPAAEIYAPEGIHKKIARKTKIDSIQSVDRLANQLPDFVALHTPPPHFFHEVWISVKQGDTSYWLVGDAFLNFDSVEGNFIMKFLLGLYGIKPGLRLHKLFPLGLDKAAFRQWGEPLFNSSGKHVLLPCHQDVYNAPDCGEKLASIVRTTV